MLRRLLTLLLALQLALAPMARAGVTSTATDAFALANQWAINASTACARNPACAASVVAIDRGTTAIDLASCADGGADCAVAVAEIGVGKIVEVGGKLFLRVAGGLYEVERAAGGGFKAAAPSTALTPIAEFVDLTGGRRDHILNGHLFGAGKSGKTEFPQSWDADRIMHQVSDVATDPNSMRGLGKWDSPYVTGVRDGIEIRVDFYPDLLPSGLPHPNAGKISTAYPTNTPVNP